MVLIRSRRTSVRGAWRSKVCSIVYAHTKARRWCPMSTCLVAADRGRLTVVLVNSWSPFQMTIWPPFPACCSLSVHAILPATLWRVPQQAARVAQLVQVQVRVAERLRHWNCITMASNLWCPAWVTSGTFSLSHCSWTVLLWWPIVYW